VLNLTHWHEFLLCLERAGFRGKKMISSENAIIFSYAMWLIGRVDYGVPVARLREVIARWFFMAHHVALLRVLETQVAPDLAQLSDLAHGDGDGFVAALARIVDDTLTPEFWEITLPNELASSASKSPALLAYITALNIVDADALLSTAKVRARLDPAVTAKKGIERHHLFPRAYLRKQKVTGTKQINQIASMALVEWHDNIAISDLPPATYWPDQLAKKKLPEADLAEQLRWHALPQDWTGMPYEAFLAERRKLMAAVVRTAFGRLADQRYEPHLPGAGRAHSPAVAHSHPTTPCGLPTSSTPDCWRQKQS
jgi:hypothetical protein